MPERPKFPNNLDRFLNGFFGYAFWQKSTALCRTGSGNFGNIVRAGESACQNVATPDFTSELQEQRL